MTEIDLAYEDRDREWLARKIDKALVESGFFFVCNHGIDQSLLQRMWSYASAFHALPLDEKQQLARIPGTQQGYVDFDGVHARYENVFPETCDMANNNQWPDECGELAGFRETCAAYANAVNVLGKRLLPLIEIGMGLEEGRLSDAFEKPQGALNLRYYKSVPKGTSVCCVKPHTDSGVLTFLPQQEKVPSILPKCIWNATKIMSRLNIHVVYFMKEYPSADIDM